MQNEYYEFLKGFVKNLIDSTYKEDNNILVVKHYYTFELSEEMIHSLVKKYGEDDFQFFYRRFHRDEMVDAYDPFFGIIRELYHRYYSDKSVEEFLESFEIYSMHKSVFSAYLREARCYRDEDLILSEVEYEQEAIKDTIVKMLVAIAREHPFVLCIHGLNGASEAALAVLMRLLDTPGNGRIILVAAYNDLRPVLPHNTAVWEQYEKRLEIMNCIVDGSMFNTPVLKDTAATFHFHLERFSEYITKLNNMFHMLEFEQANYYLGIIYKNMEMEHIVIDDVERFEILKTYAKISIYCQNIPNALLICNNLNNIAKRNDSFHMSYDYNYLLGLTQVYNMKLHMARGCADICYRLAKGNGTEFLMFKAMMLKHMASMSGWHNILFCANDIDVEPEILELAEKYQYQNHLAHTYIYAFDNEIDWSRDINEVTESMKNFAKGMGIAEQIGNRYLMSVGYRKNIMLSSINGAFDITTYYYGKLSSLVGDSDPMKAADIYKGLGYNLCAAEKYEEANREYNKAIDIYYKLGMMEFVGETLYNMSINCMLAGDYKTAYDNLLMCIRIIEALHLNDLRVCNISKLFGLLGLCSYRLGMIYNCQMYTEKTMQFLSHKLNSSTGDLDNIDPSYTVCDDDMFLNFYVKGLLYMHKDLFTKALVSMKNAEIYAERSKGFQFFSYVQYRLSVAELYQQLHQQQKSEEQLALAYEYAKRNKAEEKKQMVEAVLNQREFIRKKYSLTCENITLEQIGAATEQEGINRNYIEIKKQLDFIGVWQKIVDIIGKEKNELITNALNSFILNFGVDVMIYINYKEQQGQICFNNSEQELTQEDMEHMLRYFQIHRNGFVASKMHKDFQEYREILSIFGINDVCSMICIPVYVEEKLCDLFICYIYMKDNWNSATNKYMMDENDYNIYTLVLNQLVNAINLLEKQQEINEINVQLENAAVTDYLTTLLNRDGFFMNVHKMVLAAGKNKKKLDLTVLYIDLDNFKYYNDTFGHDVGDLVLKEISKILKEKSQDNGFATRFGGDEFLVILEHADSERAMNKAYEILNSILARDAFMKEIKEFLGRKSIVIPADKKVSCSIGVAPVADVKDDDDITRAIKKADDALYGIKHSTKCDCKLAE
ncbi:MAG: GGDEF domain-containing protein [Lachnospiraceae bacterium]|nr:GGDEF domain-containing protein [Lachnospiraceae bacterium]